MSNKLRTRSVIFAALVAAWSVSGAALAIGEVEPNDAVGTAQRLVIGNDGTVTVTGVVGVASGNFTEFVRDVDFYSFEGKAGDVITVDIDGGMITNRTGVDTVLGLFGPKGSNPLFMYRMVDNPTTNDPGSVIRLDSRIDNFVLEVTGKYYIGVSSAPGMFVNATTLSSGALQANSNGAYTLIVSGVTPSIQQINIIVKPDTTEVARVNVKAKGRIPVALLSSAEFDAMAVDPQTLTFGAQGDEQSLERCNEKGRDYNGDGRLDRVCHFDLQAANFELGDTEGVIRGSTDSGMQFEGRGFLKIISVAHRNDDAHQRDHGHGDHDRGHDDDHDRGKH
jgi:hypothetical protein